ncbi:hypothetical protein RRF57_004279 [Xylaria bambusicola]|uniref:Zn(2)-C6 fungal-type domain-containing protein n=1 Tax=Xylaria bambusicola TaxID=326684 RepID=A0AAN7UVY8_9PEZI
MEKKKGLPIRDAAAPEPKRRRVRKGTRSCWECRRRKIRCIYPSEDSSICANCETRGTSCVSQEFVDEPVSAPNQRVTQRLGRVEEMLEQLIEKIMPDSYTPGSRVRSTDSSPASADATELEQVDSGCPYEGAQPPMCDVLAPLRDTNNGTSYSGNLPTPESSQHGVPVLGRKYTDLSKTLHDLLPCQQDLHAITEASPGVNFVISFFSRYRDVVAGQTEKPSILCKNPSPSSHPIVLAKRLMQIATCLQQIQPATPIKLVAAESTQYLSRRYVSAVSNLVAYNDELVGYVEGLETLAFLALYHANVGNLRKSWLMLRRTLSIAQLMGVDRWGDRPLRSADPASNPATRTKARAFWFRINFTDRYLSLLLGLPAGTDDNSFLADDPDDKPTDRLEKQHTVVMGAIIKRNTSNKGDACFTTTQEIDCTLEAAVRSVPPDFWQFPSISTLEHPDLAVRMSATSRLMLQMNHHNLLILLHLPYMLRDPKERRWDYSKETCIGSSRKFLKTFLVFRSMNRASHACRHTDYGALTASMTLLLGYLDPKMQTRDQYTTSKREADRKLIQDARDRLLRMADSNNDKLARDAASVIGRLLPLLNPDLMTSGSNNQSGSHNSVGETAAIHLDIPYLGIININPAAHANSEQHGIQQHTHATSTTSINTDTSATPASTTTASTKTNQQDYVKFPAYASLSHVSQPSSADWNVSANQQHFTLSEGDQENEASHMLSFSMDYSDNSNESDFNGLTAPMMQFEWSQAQLAHPELVAEADEWTFQGFDTTYFESLFSSNTQGLWDMSKT